MQQKITVRNYISLVLLVTPALFFIAFLVIFRNHENLLLSNNLLYLPWQFIVLAIAGICATIGGFLDWKFHRDPLKLKISKKERDAEASALGIGGVPMFFLMCFATLSSNPQIFLIPILVVLIYTVVAICYDEFIFHIKRCGKTETIYHRMLVFGNGLAWLAWIHFIYVR